MALHNITSIYPKVKSSSHHKWAAIHVNGDCIIDDADTPIFAGIPAAKMQAVL